MAKTNASNPLATIEPQTGCDMSLAGSGDYLRRLKLCADLTAEVKDKLAQPGDYFLTGVENLGNEVEVVLVKARPHALQLTDGSSKVGAESFVMNDPVFQEIRAEKDANPSQQEPNNMYGYDFLLWLPASKQFVTIYLCKMALFKSVPSFNKNLGKFCIMASREERSKRNTKITYRVPTLQIAADQDYEGPSAEEFKHAIDLFDHPRAQRAGEAAEQRPASSKAGAAKKGGRKGR
jgi:hypothetical protein